METPWKCAQLTPDRTDSVLLGVNTFIPKAKPIGRWGRKATGLDCVSDPASRFYLR
jgi:hypothetical protein